MVDQGTGALLRRGFVVLCLLVGAACGLEPASAPDDVRVGVYYYPWHGSDFHGGQYLRERLLPPQQPVLGEYDDRSPATISQHVEWSRQAGIDMWALSWWGPDSREDATIRDVIFAMSDLGGVALAIHYETVGRTNGFSDYSRLESDFAYLARTYFGSEEYFRVASRPVVFVYLTRVLADQGMLTESVNAMRAGAASEGFDVFLVGDHAFAQIPQPSGIAELDAITNYDVYGAMGVVGRASNGDVDRYLFAQEEWRDAARDSNVGFVPSITPGFNDSAVRSGHQPLGRRMAEPNQRSLFAVMLEGATGLRDSRMGGLVMVTSWNEWHEDTQIEPVAPAAATSFDDSPSGKDLTHGLFYEGYGTAYLEILADVVGSS